MNQTTKYVLAIAVLAFTLRMVFVSQSDGLAFSAYETVQQARHIQDTGIPLISETPNGRYIPLPVFPYLLAFSTLLLPENFAYLVIPNILAVLAHIVLFYLIFELTGNQRYALLGSFASIFIPAYWSVTLLTASSLSLAIPLLLYCVLLYLKLRKTKERRNLLLAAFILLSFTHPLALICIPFLTLSLILSTVRDAKGEPAQQEFAIFALFYLVWLYILLFKQFVGRFGQSVFSANIPPFLATTQDIFSLRNLGTEVGVLIFGLALYATYKETSAQHIGIQAIIALGFSIVLTMWLGFMPIIIGGALLGMVCAVLASVGLLHMQRYLQSLRKSSLHTLIPSAILILFVLTSCLPTLVQGVRTMQTAVPPSAQLAADWIKENTPKGSTLLAEPTWGYFLETQTDRPIYLTNNYLLYDDADVRYEKTALVLHEHDLATLRTMHNIEYIVSIESPHFSCVNVVYAKEIFIGKVLC